MQALNWQGRGTSGAGARILCAGILMVAATIAGAADWKPAKNIEIVVASGAGGGQDKTGRMVQQAMQAKQLAANSVVVNKPGGGGTIAWSYLNQQAGDGHYISIAPSALMTNQILGNSSLIYTDYTPLALLNTQYVTISARADAPFRTLKELMERLKKDPESVSISVGSRRGDANHITISTVAKAAGVDVRKLKIVVFKSGAEPIPALLGGHIDVLIGAGNNVLSQMESSKVRVLGISAPQRVSGALAEVPTLREQGVDAVVPVWLSAIGPRNLTAAQIAYWDGVFASVVKTDEWKAGLKASLMEGTYMSSAETRKFFAAQHDELKQVLTELGLAK
jgi:putative tricarboxylic transport membrane protein